MAGKTVNYNNVLDVQQTIRYNVAATDGSGNAGYYPVAIVTNLKTQGDDGSVRDTQRITNEGAFQVAIYTPQQLYTIVNGSTAGTLLAAELLACYNTAAGVTVS